MDPTELKNELDSTRDTYRQFTDGNIPCKHIYENLFFSEDCDPYTTEGHQKLQWAEHQVKAATGFLESRTSTKRNLKQVSSFKDASATSAWLNDLLGAVQSCEKASKTLRSENWDSKAHLANCGKIMSSLLAVRKAFISRIQSTDANFIVETDIDKKTNKIINALGQNTPAWMQKICEDALGWLHVGVRNSHRNNCTN